MTPAELQRFRHRLLALRSEALSAGPDKIQPNRTDDATVGVGDEDAQALSEMHQAIASQRNRDQAELVRRIDLALKKIAEAPDDFGLCEDCEDDIAAKRLEVMPYVTLCVACQGKRDLKRRATRRKLTDYK